MADNIVGKIVSTAATTGGDFVRLSVELVDGNLYTLHFPYALCAGIVTTLQAGAALAHREQMKKLGSDQAVVDAAGFSPIIPNGVSVSRGIDPAGADMILVRLLKGEFPIVDAVFTPNDAETLANDILAEVDKGPAPKPIKN